MSKIPHTCQNPLCRKVRLLIPYWATRKKYCSASCASIHQKALGIRKNHNPNSLETAIRIHGEEKGTNLYKERIDKLSKFIKENPIKNRPTFMSEETKKKIKSSRKASNDNKKLSLKKSIADENLSKQLQYDSLHEKGSHDKLKEKMKDVFTLDWFIVKYGDTVGREKYRERCDNIKATSHFKKYNKENKNNVSKISQKIFNTIYENEELALKCKKVYFADLNHEYGCGTSRNFDFVVLDDKKIIEFNGDKFHANPTMYAPEDTPNPYIKNLTASQIWTDDLQKLQAAQNNGYEILIIWESEYNDNPEYIIEKCIKFLNNTYT